MTNESLASSPTRVFPNGRKEWWRDNQLERAEWSDGTIEFYKDGKLELIKYPDGAEEYFLSGERHRADGKPAISIPALGVEEYLEKGDFHREGGPAIVDSVGQKFYYIRGVSFPKSLYEKVMSRTITAKDFLDEPNLERRRVIMERMGSYAWLVDHPSIKDRLEVLEESGREKLLLLKKTTAEREDVVLVVLEDSTTHGLYVLRVPPTTKSIKAAKAWTFQVSPEEYKPAVET